MKNESNRAAETGRGPAQILWDTDVYLYSARRNGAIKCNDGAPIAKILNLVRWQVCVW
jgi:hypothetical protein